MDDYLEELAIDPHNLDEECMRQSIYFDKYAKIATEARGKRDAAYSKRKMVKSMLMNEVLNDPALAPGGKATGAGIEAYYRNAPEYIKAERDFVQAAYEADQAEIAVRSFSNKKDMLDKMVKLFLADYFSVVRKDTTSKPGKRLPDKKADQVAKRSRAKINRKRK